MQRYQMDFRREPRDNVIVLIGTVWDGWTGKTVWRTQGEDEEKVRLATYHVACVYPRMDLVPKETQSC